MIVKYRLSLLEDRAHKWPNGRAASILSHGRIEGQFVVLDAQAHYMALKEHRQELPARYNIAKIQSQDPIRPEGFGEFVLLHGNKEGDDVVLSRAAWNKLRERFYGDQTPSLQEPSLAELAENFTGAVSSWAKNGFMVVDRGVYETRHEICLKCEHWLPHGMLGIGKCRKCGCSKVKLWLATARCPDAPPRW